ncbi:MAG: DUF6596 domain-containing protein [Ilumatobacteraceae bacterium]
MQLYVLCAHPSLSAASAIALTLRAVGGLTTRQIAEAYLVPEATMAQRISRAKRTLAGERFERPGDLTTVMRVLYLVFNEGYSGDVDLAAEAIRLARQLAATTTDAEVEGLLALMLLHHARRASRTRADGSIVTLAEQDRERWDRTLAAEGIDVLHRPGAIGSASTRPKRRSPRCTSTRPPSPRPIGCRSSSGTTSLPRSPTPPSCDSTAPSPWVRRTAHPPGSLRSPGYRRARPGARRRPPTYTNATASWNSPPACTSTAREATNVPERTHQTRQAARVNQLLARRLDGAPG